MINELQNHMMAQRPRSCGRVSSTDYYRWKIYHQQRWRFEGIYSEAELLHIPVPMKPIEINKPKVQHDTPPRKGDSVFVYGKPGVILWIDHGQREACVLNFATQDTDTYPLDLFEANVGSRTRWRIL